MNRYKYVQYWEFGEFVNLCVHWLQKVLTLILGCFVYKVKTSFCQTDGLTEIIF